LLRSLLFLCLFSQTIASDEEAGLDDDLLPTQTKPKRGRKPGIGQQRQLPLSRFQELLLRLVEHITDYHDRYVNLLCINNYVSCLTF